MIWRILVGNLNHPTRLVCALAAFGIIAVGTLEWLAIEHGIDGVAFAAAIAAIVGIVAGVCGFRIGKGGDKKK